MDAFKDYFYVGVINKIHGNRGEISAYLDVDEPQQYQGLDMIFLNINNSPVPYFIDSIKILNNKAVIAFEGMSSGDQAADLVKKEMYLPLSVLPPLTGNKFYYHEVEGFTIVDEKHGELGPLTKILDYPNQAVMQIFRDEKEILIPVNDDIIQKVDRAGKVIRVKAPEGLIEIYLDA